MPFLKGVSVAPSDVEDEALPPPETSSCKFDGHWQATARDEVDATVTVIISGTRVWHDGNLLGTVRILDELSCVLTLPNEDARGKLSQEGLQIVWSDGDSWQKSEPMQQQNAPPTHAENTSCATAQSTAQETNSTSKPLSTEALRELQAAAAVATLERDTKQLSDAFSAGVCANMSLDTDALREHLRFPMSSDGKVPLLAACLLLEWPDGVELCVQHGADVNGIYVGNFHCADGSVMGSREAVPMLRLALSTRGPSQALVCRILLGGKIRAKTVQKVKRKCRAEMEIDTAYLLDNWVGPFLEQF
eukprot:TRINITY_DN56960_c0_g1_i1.p1 TRINITY_DN56960_c0_g1~~TRINITY_DN56960_c0_g1_i1.p1  ORF type:complete len:304 (+),score=56.82 TRINITY_DN56960_c0_g1_i1:38-949(+)